MQVQNDQDVQLLLAQMLTEIKSLKEEVQDVRNQNEQLLQQSDMLVQYVPFVGWLQEVMTSSFAIMTYPLKQLKYNSASNKDG